MSAGKGSKMRPAQVSKEELANNWKNTFGNKSVNTLPTTTPLYKEGLTAYVTNVYRKTITRAMPTFVEIWLVASTGNTCKEVNKYVYHSKEVMEARMKESFNGLVTYRELDDEEKSFFSK